MNKRKHKLAIIINCNDTELKDLKEYLQFVVLPSIETGNECEAIKIKGNTGSWSAYYRPLKNEYKEPKQTEIIIDPKETSEPDYKEPKRKFSWLKNDNEKIAFIELNKKNFEMITKLRHETIVLRGDNNLVKELGTKAREVLGYSSKSSCRDIVTLLHNLYLKNKNNDN